MSWTRYIIDPLQTALTYIDKMVSPLTSAAKAVYDWQAVQHIQQGFSQITRVPGFLSHAKQTRDLIKQSMITNLLCYAMPVILYRRGMDMLLDKTPDTLDPLLVVFDQCVTMTLLTRLFLLRMLDNTFYTLSLSKTISNDILEQLPKEMASILSRELASIFKRSILKNGQAEDYLQMAIAAELECLFKKFFLNNIFSAESFNGLQSELEKSFIKLIQQHDSLAILSDFIQKFSGSLARVTIDQLAFEFAQRKPDILLDDRNEFIKTLSMQFTANRSVMLVDEMMGSAQKTIRAVKSYLPVQHLDSCGCGTLKLARAKLSTPLCHIGNMVLSLLPMALNNRGWFLPDFYQFIALIATLMKFIVYGQSLDAEYKTPDHCTKHRYRVFSRNKAYSFGVGAFYVLSMELLAKLLGALSGVDNFFTRDALACVLIEFMLVATLAYRDALPGKKENTWDIFSVPRKITMTTANKIHGLFFSDLNRPESREKCYEYYKRKLNSVPQLLSATKWLFSGNDFFPQFSLDVTQLDLLSQIIHRPAATQFVKLHQHVLQEAIPAVESAHAISRWIKQPILFLPASWVSAFIVFPVLFLKEESLKSIVKAIELQLAHICIHVAGEVRIMPSATPEIVEMKQVVIQKKLAADIAEALASPMVPLPRLPVVKVETVVHFGSESDNEHLEDHSDLEDDDIYIGARKLDLSKTVKASVSYSSAPQMLWKRVKVLTQVSVAPSRRADDEPGLELNTI